MADPKQNVQRVLTYISNGLKNENWPMGTSLPSTRQLAKLLHVNTATLNAGLKILSAKKAITILRGKGIYAGDCFESPQPLTATFVRKSRWEEIRRKIESDILDNRFFDQNNEYSLNEIARHYGTCFVTVKKSIAALQQDHLIEQHGNKFRLVKNHQNPATASILFISHTANPPHLSLFNDNIRQALSTLEMECFHHNLRLEKKGLADNPDQVNSQWSNSKTGHFGYLIYSLGFSRETLQKIIRTISASSKAPVSVIDEYGNVSADIFEFNTINRMIFSIAGYLAGKTMGRFLLTQGHRRVVFLAYAPDVFWSQERVRGLREAFSNAGFPDGITEHYLDSVRTESTLLPRQKQILEQIRMDFDTSFDSRYYYGSMLMSVLQQVQLHESLYKRYTHELFDKAAKESAPTAWVCANDGLALAALHYLKNTANSPRITITGFDDERQAAESNLTTYNFALPLLCRKALSFIVQPNLKSFQKTLKIECEGMLIERESTRTKTIGDL